tara:strand:+ start:681 stop:3089 length:2409 start_codon:yes stop_codon:yes gene_type:complete
MDLSQKKLTKEEWEALEVPVDKAEQRILKLIKDGWENPDITMNDANTLLKMMKITDNLDMFHGYFYTKYFKENVQKLVKKYSLKFDTKEKKSKKKIKKKELFRMQNFDKKVDDLDKTDIYEYLLLKMVKKYLGSKDKKNYYYYIISQLIQNSIANINSYVEDFVNFILKENKAKIKLTKIIKNSQEYIEKNQLLLKYSDIKLYSHQKELIKNFKNKTNKMVLYQAPTGTGKTLSPIALSQGKKIIFVCAAKHIGLQLAKSCISLEIPIAVAFGCTDPGDIRLHYFAAKDFTKNYRSGGIFRVDNSVGDKVEVIISDIQSYLPSMNYMLAFNKEEDLVWYWDEPTITLDYKDHPFHKILKRNWNENVIPNIVLSSATLPNMEDIAEMLQSYRYKFKDSNIIEVLSYECKKSIPIISKEGYKMLPHYMFESYDLIKDCYKHIEKNKTLLRHFDVEQITKFITYVNKNKLVAERYFIDAYFEDISEINIINIKMYYLLLLKKCKNKWEQIYDYFKENRKQTYKSTIKVTTNDANTLTDGPTIFLTSDVKKLAGIYLNASNISEEEIDNVMNIINKNEKWKKDLEKIEENEKQRQDKKSDELKDKNLKMDTKEYQILEAYKKKSESLRNKIKAVELKKKFVPNTKPHLRKWTDKDDITNEFTCDISDYIVEEIMLLNISNAWKILLLMGIGCFIKEDSNNEVKKDKDKIKYMEIMKKLAEDQKLYLIIASSDYIYGTNYQFCHGYLSKDLVNMTQEKTIQAFGRIGRKNNQMDYTLRIRDNSLIEKLFLPEENKIEVNNMNKLFAI